MFNRWLSPFKMYWKIKKTSQISNSLSNAHIFESLNNSRRIHVINIINDIEESNVSDLSETVASIEYGKDIADLTEQERKRVYVSLYQTHLPKLDEVNVIDFNQQKSTVLKDENCSSMASIISVANYLNNGTYSE